MPIDPSARPYSEQLLGELETEIASPQHRTIRLQPGEQINLEREPRRSQENNAIRVENGRFEAIGYLPADMAHWLAPLIDSGRLRVEGHALREDRQRLGSSSQAARLQLSFFLCGDCGDLIEKTSVRNIQDAVHEVVRQAYVDAQKHADARRVLEMAEGLEPLKRQELLPETRLLLALFPGLAREIQAVQGIAAMNKLRAAMAGLTIGEALQQGNLTLFPLSWPESAEPPYALFSQAIESGMAVVEEIGQGGSMPEWRVRNDSDLPLLIPEGEVLIGLEQTWTIRLPFLVPAQSAFTVAEGCLEQGRRYPAQPSHADPLLPETAAGMVIGRGTKVLAVDLFDSPRTFQAQRRRLAGVDGVGNPQKSRTFHPTSPEIAQRFLETVQGRAKPRVPPLGLGDELEITGGGVLGAAVLCQGRLCHLSAFGEESSTVNTPCSPA